MSASYVLLFPYVLCLFHFKYTVIPANYVGDSSYNRESPGSDTPRHYPFIRTGEVSTRAHLFLALHHSTICMFPLSKGEIERLIQFAVIMVMCVPLSVVRGHPAITKAANRHCCFKFKAIKWVSLVSLTFPLF